MKLTKRQLRHIIYESIKQIPIRSLPIARNQNNDLEMNIGYDYSLKSKIRRKNRKHHKRKNLKIPIELDSQAVPHKSDYGGKHKGVDIFARLNAPVLSITSGFVHKAQKEKGKGGNVVIISSQPPINHDQDLESIDYRDYRYSSDTYHVRYAHLNTIDVSKGESINSGTVIGTVGDTGSAYAFTLSDKTKGGHLHLSIYGTDKHGRANYYYNNTDPGKFLNAYLGAEQFVSDKYKKILAMAKSFGIAMNLPSDNHDHIK